MPSSAVAGMVFLLSQELFQMVKPMTEIELNEKIENLLTESAPVQSSRRTGSAYRREMRIRKNDALMRIVTRKYVPHAGYIDYGFDGDTLLHSGKYLPTHPVHHTKKCAWAVADLSFRAGSAGGQHAFFHPV